MNAEATQRPHKVFAHCCIINPLTDKSLFVYELFTQYSGNDLYDHDHQEIMIRKDIILIKNMMIIITCYLPHPNSLAENQTELNSG